MRAFQRLILPISAGLVWAAYGCVVWPSAAQAERAQSDEYSVHLGTFLPNQIDGVTDMLPMFGFRYAYALAPALSIESGLMNSHAYGVDFTALTVDVRADVDLGDQIFALAYGGITFDYYSQINTANRLGAWGGNVGGALEFGLTDAFWLRGDMGFSAQPGTALFIGAGFALRL